jgi:hypothetical protein
MRFSSSPNPYQAPRESEEDPSFSDGLKPSWFTRVLLVLSLIFTGIYCITGSAGLINTSINGPTPPPARYGPVHFFSFGSAALFPFAAFWGMAALTRRRVWRRSYLYLALVPLGLLLVLWMITFVVACTIGL